MDADFDLSVTGFELDEIDRFVLDDGPAGNTDDDEAPEPPEHPVTRTGDLWLLGDHRLVCGDATTAADVEKVVDGGFADLCFTDPPYNVDHGRVCGASRLSICARSRSWLQSLSIGPKTTMRKVAIGPMTIEARNHPIPDLPLD